MSKPMTKIIGRYADLYFSETITRECKLYAHIRNPNRNAFGLTSKRGRILTHFFDNLNTPLLTKDMAQEIAGITSKSLLSYINNLDVLLKSSKYLSLRIKPNEDKRSEKRYTLIQKPLTPQDLEHLLDLDASYGLNPDDYIIYESPQEIPWIRKRI